MALSQPSYFYIHRALQKFTRAIVDGYRLADTSPFYNNQREVGAGVRDGIKTAGIRREDVWVITKLWTPKLVPSMTFSASLGTLSNFPIRSHNDPTKEIKNDLVELGLDYVDLYLIHWPMGAQNIFDHVPVRIEFSFLQLLC
jgi:diketogulonate reductase-like aldo/keto reductase